MLRSSVNRPHADLLTCQKQASKADFTRRALTRLHERSGTSQSQSGLSVPTSVGMKAAAPASMDNINRLFWG